MFYSQHRPCGYSGTLVAYVFTLIRVPMAL